MTLTFDQAVNLLQAAPVGARLVVPVRITAHGEDGTVLYGYGGLGLIQPPERRLVHVTVNDLVLSQANSYAFVGARLATENMLTNQRVRLLNNVVYDAAGNSDNLIPPTFQSFLVGRPQAASVEIGWASTREDPANQHLILRVARGELADFSVTDVEVEQREALLTGLGALNAGTAALWTVSFLNPIAWAGNEIG